MKLLILSDSHGNYPAVFKAIEQAGNVDHIIHLGDGIEDARIVEKVLNIPLIKVVGNCDPISTMPDEIIQIFSHQRCFITHGNSYLVKTGLDHLHFRAVNENANVVLYGHTHTAAIETINNILYVNPGCLHKAWFHKSFAVVTIGEDGASAEILEIP